MSNKKNKNSKNSKYSLGDMISSLTDDLDLEEQKASGVPDIITFCEGKQYLAMGEGNNPINLYPMQKLVLKAFYRGSRGNENLTLTDEEIELCHRHGLTNEDRGDVLGKYESGELFNELVLIWGRRSGKDFLASIIALYEAMRLLEAPGGDPYKYYNVASGEPITILTIANSKSQAGISFNMIREKLRLSPYFKDKFVPEGLASQSISLLTPRDKELNKEYVKKGEPVHRGSVVIEVGHSNSDTLLGKGCFVLILDEVASYKVGTGGSGSGERIYAAMLPTINTYLRMEPMYYEDGTPVLDEDGKHIERIIYDGKIISISSPRGKEGKLWELYETAPETPSRLMCRLPTWVVNKFQTRESLRDANTAMSEMQFEMEFGAEFSGTAGETMFSRDKVDLAFKNDLSFRETGIPGLQYFVHLDPATNSHNYALAVVHGEYVVNNETHTSDMYVVVDHIKYWTPSATKSIDINEVDEYVVSLRRKFPIAQVTYDQWNSTASIQKLKKRGVPAKMTPFNRKYKMAIYKEFEMLLNAERVIIPWHELLRDEMISLQRKFDAQGFKVYPKNDEDGCQTDDIIDAVVGATYSLINRKTQGLPKGKLVNTGVTPQGNNIPWRTMQGIQGYGPGQSVSKALERRKSWPNYKR